MKIPKILIFLSVVLASPLNYDNDPFSDSKYTQKDYFLDDQINLDSFVSDSPLLIHFSDLVQDETSLLNLPGFNCAETFSDEAEIYESSQEISGKSTQDGNVLRTFTSSDRISASESSSSSEVKDYDSSSDFEIERKGKKRRLRPAQKKSKAEQSKKSQKVTQAPIVQAKEKEKQEETDLTTSEKEQQIPKREKFCWRNPFLYRPICSCERIAYNYITAAIKHLVTKHDHMENSKTSFMNSIELIDDFGVIDDYPICCNLCPFRTNQKGYLYNHKSYVHLEKKVKK